MLLAFVLAAAVCAVLIVGPRQAIWGLGVRIVQLGGALLGMLAVGIGMTYVVPFLLMVGLGLAAFAALVAGFVYLFGLPGGGGSSTARPARRLGGPKPD